MQRRTFIQSAALAGLGTEFSLSQNLDSPKPKKSLTFLFQGDSITDGNRGRNLDPNHIMGHGYAYSVASRISAGRDGFGQRLIGTVILPGYCAAKCPRTNRGGRF